MQTSIRKLGFVALAAFVGLAVFVLPMAAAVYGETVDMGNDLEVTEVDMTGTKLWIFDVNCTESNYFDRMEAEIKLYKTPHQYLSPTIRTHEYEFVCFGGIDFLTVDSVTVPILRAIYPNDVFLFIWEPQYRYSLLQEMDNEGKIVTVVMNKDVSSYREQFNKWAETMVLESEGKTVSVNDRSLYGYAIIKEGYGIARGASVEIVHELAHLTSCKVHDGVTPDKPLMPFEDWYYLYEPAYPWCMD